ncbi:MAG: hypothetical protein KatS3mg131_3789 [Candidatus Tectimicrobiota bacterium]|nr:MAG: hypothetical protein KatS3mg131_3789 [Candidatus Tectomicrobia bacterium]
MGNEILMARRTAQAMPLEHVLCALCDASDEELLVTKKGFRVVRCRRCRLVYVNPRPQAEALAVLYNAAPEGHGAVAGEAVHPGHERYKMRKFQRAVAFIRAYQPQARHVFDLGCARGAFLALAASQGWVPYGSDVNPHFVAALQRQYGPRVQLQQGTRLAFPDAAFDVVTLFDTIEHLPAPLATLHEVRRVLRPGGLCVITTPNVEGLFPRCTYRFLGRTLGAWEHPTPPAHLYQFAPHTLRALLDRAGLPPVAMRTFGIYPPYTALQLENAVIEAIKHRRSPKPHPPLAATSHRKDAAAGAPAHPLRKLPRLGLRVACWALVGSLYPLARLCDRSDAMLVAARKPA